jgi:hypothetical protein
MYAEQLRHGGALLAVRSDDARDTLVQGVFRHHANPVLLAQEEPVGPITEGELAADELGGSISTSIGALSGGSIPGSWGAAGDVFEQQGEDTYDDDRPRRETDV